MAYCHPAGEEISAARLAELANEHGMYLAGNSKVKLSISRTNTVQAFYNGTDAVSVQCPLTYIPGVTQWFNANARMNTVVTAFTSGAIYPTTKHGVGDYSNPFYIRLSIYKQDSAAPGPMPPPSPIYLASTDWLSAGQNNSPLLFSQQRDPEGKLRNGYHMLYSLSGMVINGLYRQRSTLYARFELNLTNTWGIAEEDFSLYLTMNVFQVLTVSTGMT